MTVWSILEMASSADPEAVAAQDGTRRATFGELRSRALAGAGIASAGGHRAIAFLGINGTVWPSVLFAAAAAGVPAAPLNYRLTADSIRALLARLDSPLVVHDARYDDVLADSAYATVTTDEWWSRTGGGQPLGAPSVAHDEQAAVVLFTSGTTAAPKGVLLHHRHLFSYVINTVEFGSAGAGDAALVSVPPYHVAGVGTVLSNAYAGRRVVYLPDFRPADWLSTVRSQGVTQAMLVPTMLARTVDALDDQPADLPTLRSIAYGGAAMPRPVLERALTLFPQVAFANAYGLTETSSTVAVLGPEDHRAAFQSCDERIRARLGSVGRAVPGVELAIMSEEGALCPAGQVGELVVRGDQVSGDYLETGPAIDDAGWFHTRDAAWLDDGDYLFVVGRIDDTIIRGGENIAPAEIETVLREHPAVADVGVVGLPDEDWGQRTAAVVVLRPDAALSADGLQEWARQRLRGSRTPDEVSFVDALPYNPLGKLVRRDIAEALIAQAARKQV